MVEKYFSDEGVEIVHADGKKEMLEPLEYFQVYGIPDESGVSLGDMWEIFEEYTGSATKRQEPEYGNSADAEYWGLWIKLINLFREYIPLRAAGKAVRYFPKEINDTLEALMRSSNSLGLKGLDERMLFRLEQDICSRLQAYVSLVENHYRTSSKAISMFEIYKLTHAA